MKHYFLHFSLAVPLLSGALLGCRPAIVHPTVNAQQASASSGTLAASSAIQCQTDDDCAVCYRENSCGEPAAPADPALQTPACHVSPAAFCLPRRGHCDEHRCVAR